MKTSLLVTFMNAQGVELPNITLTQAHLLSPKICTLFTAREWRIVLERAGILDKYSQIPNFISHGADAGISLIYSTFTPPNHPSIISHQMVFNEIVNDEFQKGH